MCGYKTAYTCGVIKDTFNMKVSWEYTRFSINLPVVSGMKLKTILT